VRRAVTGSQWRQEVPVLDGAVTAVAGSP